MSKKVIFIMKSFFWADQINSWKQTLSIESINAIEEECLNVLSQLEYPIIGKVDE